MKLLFSLPHPTNPSLKHMLVLVRPPSGYLILTHTPSLEISCLFEVYFRRMRLCGFHVGGDLVVPEIDHPC